MCLKHGHEIGREFVGLKPKHLRLHENLNLDLGASGWREQGDPELSRALARKSDPI